MVTATDGNCKYASYTNTKKENTNHKISQKFKYSYTSLRYSDIPIFQAVQYAEDQVPF